MRINAIPTMNLVGSMATSVIDTHETTACAQFEHIEGLGQSTYLLILCWRWSENRARHFQTNKCN